MYKIKSNHPNQIYFDFFSFIQFQLLTQVTHLLIVREEYSKSFILKTKQNKINKMTLDTAMQWGDMRDTQTQSSRQGNNKTFHKN